LLLVAACFYSLFLVGRVGWVFGSCVGNRVGDRRQKWRWSVKIKCPIHWIIKTFESCLLIS
jgi:hypothetical protein